MKTQKFYFLGILCLSLMSLGVASTANAGQLRFSMDDVIYQGVSTNPWLNEGYITKSKDFDLSLVNTFTNKVVSDATLVLSVPKTIDLDGLVVDLGNSMIFTAADFMSGNTGEHPYLTGNNGIYKDAYWLETNLGDLARYDKSAGGADTAALHVKINGMPSDALLHFDAYGNANDPCKTGKSTFCKNANGRIFVPYSEDLTVVTPEPMSAVLMLFGALAMGLVALRKRMFA